ncbi:MAG TPA: hypothetical protein PLM33_05445 [Acidobacteriota bacterium]|jgi:hypothetical protein|nr:hypothetical protein [Acidobacteriota bacterium]HRR57787.1 hypothetical protein [Acidobacteriota bacterium]
MTERLLMIIDRGAQIGLWAFFVSYVILLLAARVRLRARRRHLEDVLVGGKEADEGSNLRRRPLPPGVEWKVVLRALLPALLVGLSVFGGYLLLPLPGIENLVTASVWQQLPLRLTRLQYDRFYEGFSLEGDVWNQTDEPMSDLRCVVEILDRNEQLLDVVTVEVTPKTIPPGTSGTFRLRYTKSSPFLGGYRVSFRDGQDRPIPHMTGFDAE